MTKLATLDDLAAYTGSTADPTDRKAIDALDAASSLVRAYIGRNLDYTEDTEFTLDGTGTFALLLPEGPIEDVSLVEELDNDGDATEIEATDYRVKANTGIIYRLDQPWCEGIQNYRVTATVGYTLPGSENPTLPGEIRAVTAQVAARIYAQGTDEGRQVTQRSIGSYSETFGGTERASGGLEDAEVAILSRFRWPGAA